MIRHAAALLVLAAPLTLPAQNTERTPDELFAIARDFYAPVETRKVAVTEAAAIEALTKAGDRRHPAALYNLFIGHRFGYLGVSDFDRAAEFRARWLESIASPANYYEIGIGLLGAWRPTDDPRARGSKVNPDFIFTGPIAAMNRERSHDRRYAFFGQNKPVTYRADLDRAAYWFARAVELGANDDFSWDGADRQAVDRSLQALTALVFGEPIKLNHAPDAVRTANQTFTAIGHGRPPRETARFLLDAELRGYPLPPRGRAAAARLLKLMSPEEFRAVHTALQRPR